MLNISLTPEQVIQKHREICPTVYNNIDQSIMPDRYRRQPGKNSHLWTKTSASQQEMARDKHTQEMFRQWAMAGDPVADAFTIRFRDLKHHVAMDMLDTALEKGIDAVDNPPPELVALMKEVDHVPEWVDWDSIDQTSEIIGPYIYALGQTAWRAGFVLTFGNSYQGLPMYKTGALHKPETTPNRIKETLSVINYLAIPGGLRRNGVALKLLVKVRVMHSLVRVNLLMNPKSWDVATYGIPLPQVDMYAAWGLVSGGLEVMEKMNNQPMNISALRYLMYLSGVDMAMPSNSVEDLNNVMVMIGSTLKHRYEPWASELTESALSAQMIKNPNLLERIWDRADRKLGELAITKIMGERQAQQLGVNTSPINYLAAGALAVPIAAKFIGLKAMERLPGGRQRVHDLCLRYACENMGLDLKFDSNPKDYSVA